MKDKTQIKKFKRIKMLYCLLSDKNGIKLEISNKEIAGISKILGN